MSYTRDKHLAPYHIAKWSSTLWENVGTPTASFPLKIQPCLCNLILQYMIHGHYLIVDVTSWRPLSGNDGTHRSISSEFHIVRTIYSLTVRPRPIGIMMIHIHWSFFCDTSHLTGFSFVIVHNFWKPCLLWTQYGRDYLGTGVVLQSPLFNCTPGLR